MKFRDFVQILAEHGFALRRQKGSHRVYVGVAGGKTRMVVVAAHNWNDEIRPGTLGSMIRQSGLPKTLPLTRRCLNREGHGVLVPVLRWSLSGQGQTQSVPRELKPEFQGHRPVEQVSALVLREFRYRFKIERDRFFKGPENLLEGAPLDAYVEVKADGLPFLVLSGGVTMQCSCHRVTRNASTVPCHHRPSRYPVP